ncbi:hypothetical protein [Nocardioides yefusunii]|uniref:ABC-2 type transport system permease protein n=1 Tax=Nocardioides yefusunii TaxID=2500546 RepID=A0ABW1R1V4_9ACTN|nr:hypothetical protein [Nocardioides yefusunii]
MPTVPSSTDPVRLPTGYRGQIPSVRATGGVPATGASLPAWHPVEVRRAWDDTAHLVRFSIGTVRNPKVLPIVLGVLSVITLAAWVGPLFSPLAGDADTIAFDTLLLLPSLMIGFLGLTIASGIASGGGRELLSKENAAAFPVSATTDHFGALLLAPFNIAWMLQSWFLLGAASFAMGLSAFPYLQTLMVLWILTTTVLAQAVAWWVEVVRRGPGGVWVVRGIGLALAALAAWIQLSGHTGDVFDAAPTLEVVAAGVQGFSPAFVLAVVAMLAITVVSLYLGGWAANVAARRSTHDEAKAETRHHQPSPNPRTVTAMLRRLDRASVWRAVPMRRGITVLAVGPGLVALAGGLPWENVMILPGLVVSGGVLLFGVNAWSLDGRGGLWRESLPVDAGKVFDVRAWVMTEWLLLACAITLLLASVRAGTPTGAELLAVAVTVAVVTLQVVAVAMTWSVRKPFAVNLRSARATPAPPSVMVGYSAKLALSTTLTAMVFSTTASIVVQTGGPFWIVLAEAVPFVVWSGVRLRRARRAWVDPIRRAAVVTTVAA